VLYNGMIAPLLPYAMRGVIWYQGEANVGRERQYRTLFPALITDWRRAWSEGNFPFLFVQLAPYKGNTPELREAQLLTSQHTTNTAMAVTIDCNSDAEDIHPAHKQPMGARLALAARALAYGEKLEYSSPMFASMKIKGRNAVLRFIHVGGGLVAKDGPLQGFTMAGEDKVFHPAQAEIHGKTIVVHSAEVPRPVAVRYGWANMPEGNLFNRAGLPASPFRSDVDCSWFIGSSAADRHRFRLRGLRFCAKSSPMFASCRQPIQSICRRPAGRVGARCSARRAGAQNLKWPTVRAAHRSQTGGRIAE
jgi:sialate O-acetylesterase